MTHISDSLTSFADEPEWFITVVIIPSSPIIPLIHYTTLFVFAVVVLAFFPVLVSTNGRKVQGPITILLFEFHREKGNAVT